MVPNRKQKDRLRQASDRFFVIFRLCIQNGCCFGRSNRLTVMICMNTRVRSWLQDTCFGILILRRNLPKAISIGFRMSTGKEAFLTGASFCPTLTAAKSLSAPAVLPNLIPETTAEDWVCIKPEVLGTGICGRSRQSSDSFRV